MFCLKYYCWKSRNMKFNERREKWWLSGVALKIKMGYVTWILSVIHRIRKLAQASSQPCQTSEMEIFAEITWKRLKVFENFRKKLHLRYLTGFWLSLSVPLRFRVKWFGWYRNKKPLENFQNFSSVTNNLKISTDRNTLHKS